MKPTAWIAAPFFVAVKMASPRDNAILVVGAACRRPAHDFPVEDSVVVLEPRETYTDDRAGVLAGLTHANSHLVAHVWPRWRFSTQSGGSATHERRALLPVCQKSGFLRRRTRADRKACWSHLETGTRAQSVSNLPTHIGLTDRRAERECGHRHASVTARQPRPALSMLPRC